MSIAPDVETWSLTGAAREQLINRGITLSELYRLLRDPTTIMPGYSENEKRINGFGLTAIVCGREVRCVGIDGQTPQNWEDWAIERAEFGDADVAGADAMVRSQLEALTARLRAPMPKQRERFVRTVEPEPELVTAHVLDRVHPALHAEVTRQVEGDFSRMVVHSPTKVTILPAHG